MTEESTMIEKVARAIYDAHDSQSGDTVGTVIWNSEHLFYETLEGEEITDTARRVSMGVCRDAARAAIEAMPLNVLREALERIVASWDANTHQRERFVQGENGDYWSPHSAMVDSEHIANARAALERVSLSGQRHD